MGKPLGIEAFPKPALQHARRWGLALAALGAIGFAGKAIIVKLAYRQPVDAVTLLMLRMLIALPLFVLLAWWSGRGQARLTRRDLAMVLALGFSGYYLASFLDFLGLQFISASLERLILYLNPTLVLGLSWWFFHKPATRRQVVAMAVSYVGVLLVFAQELKFEGTHVALGASLVFASALSYAVYLVYSGEVVKRLGALRLTGWASSVACGLCVLQFLLLRSPTEWLSLPAPVFELSLINALFCTVLPVLAVMMAIERIGPALTAQVGMAGPMVTIALGAWFLNEPLTVWVVVGTMLVLLGVGMLARAR